MKKLSVLLVLALAAFALAACGDDDDEPATTNDNAPAESTQEPAGEAGGEAGGEAAKGATNLTFDVAPDGGLAYTVTTATTPAGPTTLEINNEQPLEHDVAIEDDSGKEIAATDAVTESTASTEVDLKPGEYTFFCTIPGHREGGMEGKLTVK